MAENTNIHNHRSHAPTQLRDAYTQQIRTAVDTYAEFPDMHAQLLEVPADYIVLLGISDSPTDIDVIQPFRIYMAPHLSA